MTILSGTVSLKNSRYVFGPRKVQVYTSRNQYQKKNKLEELVNKCKFVQNIMTHPLLRMEESRICQKEPFNKTSRATSSNMEVNNHERAH
ncbi:hypothetical protein BpHYR1_048416 [Brachionus plicatilis]|uniref:Uncharacterized protein n=1 Tax=Brachionus plicatilis TaxID=10195 RepID=A0A3M7Q887_BRAPC|nr:hypothetical protein BpHYR1_048416 [Brachionus plicatilis]